MFKVIPPRHSKLLWLMMTFNCLPHWDFVPKWVAAGTGLILLSKIWLLRTRRPTIPRWLTNTLAFCSGLFVFYHFGTFLGLEPAVSLLLLIGSAKSLESERYHDAMLLIFVCLFLLMCYLLFSQSLNATLYMGVDVFLIVAFLFHLHRRDNTQTLGLPSLRPILRMLWLAIPTWLALFFVFPRFSLSLWQMQTQKALAQTGFSLNLRPGEIARLVQNEATAFHVRFLKQRPSPEDMYWRGAVLHEGQGLRWDLGARLPPAPTTSSSGQVIEQEIYLTGGDGNTRFAMEYPELISNAISGGERRRYTVSSILKPSQQELTEKERIADLQTPNKVTDRVVQLAAQLEAKASSHHRKAEAVLEYFASQGFYYSKEPGSPRGDPLEHFLFNEKRGFCEHYAATFTTLMRLMKVPARVVIGYQGGTYNPYSNLLVVRELDAHAWSEYYDDESKTWVRADPTTVVAPLRQRLGGDFNSLVDRWNSSWSEEEARLRLDKGWLAVSADRLAFLWDAASTTWTQFLLNYDLAFQLRLLAKFGLSADARPYLILLLAAGIWLLLRLTVWWENRRDQNLEPEVRYYRRILRLAAKHGLEIAVGAPPLAVAQKMRTRFPKAEALIAEFYDAYTQSRFARPAPGDDPRPRTLHLGRKLIAEIKNT